MSYLFPLLILFGLIAVPDAAFSATSEAALLWWTRVLPSLLPYLVASSLLLKSGILCRSALWAAIPSAQSLRESCTATAC